MRAGAIAIAFTTALALAGCHRASEGKPGEGKPDTASTAGAANSAGMAPFSPAASNPQPGVGLAGGMGKSSGLGMTGSFPAGSQPGTASIPDGSTNRTVHSSVGNR